MMIQKKRKKNKLKKVNKKIKKKENIFKRTNSISSGSDQDMKETNDNINIKKDENNYLNENNDSKEKPNQTYETEKIEENVTRQTIKIKETKIDFDKMKSKNPNGKFLINEKFGNEDGQRVIQEVISNFLDSEAKPAIENI